MAKTAKSKPRKRTNNIVSNSQYRNVDRFALLFGSKRIMVMLAGLLILSGGVGFAIVQWRHNSKAATYPAEVRPFDPSHPVYQPVPAGATTLSNSSQIAATMKSQIGSNNNFFGFDTGGESPPIYVGKSTDPVWTVTSGCSGFSGTIKFHAPANIKAGTGSDYPLIVLDQSNSSFTTSGTQPIEFRMWQAKINYSNLTVSASNMGASSYRNDGAVLSNQKVQSGHVARALGQADACGSNTGSGESYTVGMIRPIDIQRGYIDHAVRVAAGFLRGPASGGNTNNKYWQWPALHTEGGGNAGYMADNDGRVPMGARIFLDKSVDATALGNAAAAKLSDPKNQAFARMFIKAIQDYGIIPLDGTGGGANVYFEGDATANWSSLLGSQNPSNNYSGYNHIARAVVSVLDFSTFKVTDSSVFASYASSTNGGTVVSAPTTTTPTPTPTPSTTTTTGAKPTVPKNVKVTAYSGKLVVSWDALPADQKVDTYQVYLNGSYSYTNTSATSYTITGSPGQSFSVRVSAHNSYGYGPWSGSVSGKILSSSYITKPTVPTNVKITPYSGKLVVSWDPLPADQGVDNYQVYLNGSYGYTNTKATSYTIYGSPGQTFSARVSAHNSYGYGPWSSSVSATIPR